MYIIQDGKFVFLNDFSGIVGYSSEELFEMNTFDLVHPEDRKKSQTIIIGELGRKC